MDNKIDSSEEPNAYWAGGGNNPHQIPFASFVKKDTGQAGIDMAERSDR
jgi:hypothetical protein